MGLNIWIIPLQLKTAEVYLHAGRDEVFARLTGFRENRLPNAWPRVLEADESGSSLLVEFRTPVTGLLGRRKLHRTVERVTIDEAAEVRFEGVEGPLDLLHDRFSTEPFEGGTLVRYESTIGLRGSVFGWLLCLLYVRPVMQRFMVQHLTQLKQAVEAAA
ncbi:MAG TPA: SRPBCC family protein [Dehalococcoidia bacterium]|nr:SRPBCC family protein [Dehalococcoidia bacterium]